MASKKLGNLIKEARTNAGYTQEELARKIPGVSASDISLAERGLGDLTQEQLKKIAKVTGVTQTSLLEAARGTKKSPSSSSSSSKTSMKATATEKRLVELYRKADTDTRKRAMNILKGDDVAAGEILETLLEGVAELVTK